jgi:hypothetical protein
MSLCLALLRLLLAGWAGAAALFVIVGVREVTSPALDSITRDALVLLRFPAYYAYGAGSLLLALGCCLVVRAADAGSSRKWNLCLGFILSALLFMAADYVWVYRPLAAMLVPAGSPRPSEFMAYHEASKWVNAAGWGLVLAAAALACVPIRLGPVTAKNSIEGEPRE